MLEFAATSLLIELTPGPNMAYLAAVAISLGKRRALMATLGVALGLAIVGALAAFGLTAAIEAKPAIFAALRYGGALYLFWLAIDAWRHGAGEAHGAADDFASFRRGLFTNLLNPKAALFYVAVLPSFIDPARDDLLRQNLTLVAVYVGVATAVHAMIVLMSDRLRPWLRSQASERAIRRALALALAAIAIWFLYATRR